MKKMKNNRAGKCNDTGCRYRYCKLHPRGCVIRNEEEAVLSSSLCRKEIVRQIDDEFRLRRRNEYESY